MSQQMQKNVKYKETEQKLGPYNHFYLRRLEGPKGTFWTMSPHNRIKLHIEYIVEATNIILRMSLTSKDRSDTKAKHYSLI